MEPQSELGPEILAQATYQELAWMGIGSSNSMAYFSLEHNTHIQFVKSHFYLEHYGTRSIYQKNTTGIISTEKVV